jgi:type IV pilus assembly protein PilB
MALPSADNLRAGEPPALADLAAALRAGGSSAVRLADALIAAAVRERASDIHVEPLERSVRVRFRVDGELHTVLSPGLEHRDALVSRLKVLAHLDIAERRLPQDGRLTAAVDAAGVGRAIDVRVSTLPTMFGEKVVLRLLDKEGLALDMAGLGLTPAEFERYERAIHRPWGMVLVTGPTGSGKTSTLYCSLARLNRPGVNIVTVEDPIEFSLPGISQVQVREPIGLTFANVLRALLRQDPDVILVGEIRDTDTAATAVKAALTGHLVLATLHTNDAPTSVTRLVNMGIEPFLVASSVHLVCAQRLVKRICASCHTVDRRPSPVAGSSPSTAVAFHGSGCSACRGTGYRGRVGIFEVMPITEALADLVARSGSAGEVRRLAIAEGMATLRESGLAKVRDGVTTFDEVGRETT